MNGHGGEELSRTHATAALGMLASGIGTVERDFRAQRSSRLFDG